MKIVLNSLIISSLFIFYSCSGDEVENIDSDPSDSVEVTEENTEEDISEIAFNGTEAGEYLLYGHTEITTENSITIDEMMVQFSETGTFSDKVTVIIDQVCQKAGCWITFKDSEEKEIRVFFRDHFTIPVNTESGTEAILYGELVMDTLSIDFQKHLLDDAKETGDEVSQEEYDAITADKIEVSFDCESVLVKK